MFYIFFAVLYLCAVSALAILKAVCMLLSSSPEEDTESTQSPTFQAKVLQLPRDLQVFKCPLQTHSLLKDVIECADWLSCSRSSLEAACDINLMQTT